jgi:uncharacterized protein (TIGR00369 family)
MIDPPDGFEPHFRRSGLTDPWEPLFFRRAERMIILGLRAGPAHVNARGFVHGGLIAALADNAMGLSCAEHRDGEARGVTVNLAIDYLGMAQQGAWLTFETDFVRLGATLSFAQAFVRADGAVCARANATFKVLKATR